jgi:hypothetical protein
MAYAAWVTAALAWIALPVAVLALGAVAAWP